MEDDVLGSNATPVAGTSLVVLVLVLLMSADGEVASPVNLGVAQRSDDLFEAMSDDSGVCCCTAQIVGSGATDIVGALSAMGVFDMGAPTDLTDPSLSNFMPTFDALDADAQALVLANANPLDLSSMTAVTNAVDAIEVIERRYQWC